MALPPEAVAAELAELIYERWVGALGAGAAVDFAAIEALIVMIDGLRACEYDRATGTIQLRVALEVLTGMPALPEREEFQRLVLARVRQSAPGALRTGVPKS